MNEIATTGRDVIPLRSIEELAAINSKEWTSLDTYIDKTREHIVKARHKVRSKRIQLGWRLLEIRQRIEAGERPDIPDFWQFYDTKFDRSRRDAERLMEIAAADNPEEAYALSLKRNREAVAAHRAAKAALPAPTYNEPGKSQAEPEPTEPEAAPSAPSPAASPVPSSRAKPKGLPSYTPQHLIDAAAADDASAEAEIARVVQAFLQLNERQRLRCFIRIKQVYQTRERPPRA
jgi:hypothetical protein